MSREVAFFSDGSRVAGDLHLPVAADGARSVPAFVVCPGTGGQKGHHSSLIAARLAAIGFAALAFDVRGRGESEGTKDRLYPAEVAADIRAAVAFLRSDERIDSARVSVLGLMTGAAAALHAAGIDKGIASVIALHPFGDGSRWLRALYGLAQWRAFQRRLSVDRAARARSGIAEKVDAESIFNREPHPTRTHMLGLDSADAILTFRPEAGFHRIAPRPVVVATVTADGLIPFEEVERVHAGLPGPKRLIAVPGITHIQMYDDPHLGRVLDEAVAFIDAATPRAGSPGH